jgi:hypothetical protein
VPFKILVDTCVWLDIAKDYKQRMLLEAVGHVIMQGQAKLVVPRIVIDEFARNKDRIIKDSSRSLSAALRRTKQAVEALGRKKGKGAVVRQLEDLDHRLPTLGEHAAELAGTIEKLFANAQIIETSDSVRLRAINRALAKTAPFHRQRNGAADAMLIEMYADLVAETGKGVRYAFVTHNVHDFSDMRTNNKLPHPDIAPLFSKVRSLYCITLADVLGRISKHLLPSILAWEEWGEQSRGVGEIVDAVDLLTDQVWYNRHMVRKERVDAGITKLVDKETFPVVDHETRPIQKEIWEGALKAAARLEKKLGLEVLGPWDDFEWGMINGKLSALRWVLGDEWDMLDT